jgi:hypothetical protein
MIYDIYIYTHICMYDMFVYVYIYYATLCYGDLMIMVIPMMG